jgi:hypothetical protein
MPREAKQSDFHVDVEGVGKFLFARRAMGDVFKIRGEYKRLTGGNYTEDGRMADLSALGFVTIQTLLVEGPKSFNVETLDPLVDEDFDDKILKVYFALLAKEQSFRPKPETVSEAARSGNGEQPGAVVSPDVPAGTN